MSDLFIGEILVLCLLIPVLLRPFSRRLQRIPGLAIFPLLAFLLALSVIAACGLRFSFIPVLLFSFIVLCFGLFRLFRFFRRLPTDWYSPTTTVFAGFLILLLAGVVWVSLVFAPENLPVSDTDIKRVIERQNFSLGTKARITILSSSENQQTSMNSVVLILQDIPSKYGGRSTTALSLAENGYIVVEPTFIEKHTDEDPMASFLFMRGFLKVLTKIAAIHQISFDSDDALQVRRLKEISLSIQYIRSKYGRDVPLFVLAEGSFCNPLISRLNMQSDDITGAICLVSEEQLQTVTRSPATRNIVIPDNEMMPANAGSFTVCALVDRDSALYGLGELSADDVLAAFLCGGQRDVGRKQAELTAGRILSWYSLRRQYDNSGT